MLYAKVIATGDVQVSQGIPAVWPANINDKGSAVVMGYDTNLHMSSVPPVPSMTGPGLGRGKDRCTGYGCDHPTSPSECIHDLSLLVLVACSNSGCRNRHCDSHSSQKKTVRERASLEEKSNCDMPF